MDIDRKYTLVYLSLIVYAICILVFTSVIYNTSNRELLNKIDQKLELGAIGLNSILGKDFHSNLSKEQGLSPQKNEELDLKLTDYANDLDLAYVYSLKKFPEGIRFVVSSITPAEQEDHTYKPVYFDEYSEMDTAVELAFSSGIKQFAEYQDQWGKFRSVFIPFTSAPGSQYVLGADIRLREVNAILHRGLIYAMIGCFLFVFITLPLVIIMIRSIGREHKQHCWSLTHDMLTGMANKHQLFEDLKNHQNVHLGIIKINRFSDITTVYGPAISDNIIKQFSCRLANYEHEKIRDYRAFYIDGNDFAVLVTHKIDPAAEDSVVNGLVSHLTVNDYKLTEDKSIHLSISLGGIHATTEDTLLAEDIYSMANIAVAEAHKRNLCVFIYDTQDENLPKFYKENLQRIENLKRALLEKRLIAYYQPIFRSGKIREISHYECLARIVDFEGNVLFNPDEFIPYAHRAKLYYLITNTMVIHAINHVIQTNNSVSVNISVSDIMSDHMSYNIYKKLKRSGIAHKIQFELLEDEHIEDIRHAVRTIKMFKSIGVRFGIDDVGKNYSNFDRLISLPVDFIKIDRSVIQYIARNEDTRKIVQDLISVAHKKDVEVVAEYCAAKEITDMAESLGADYLQGFYLAKPSKPVIVS